MPSAESPVRSLRRQVDAVRRRHNLHAVQDALALWATAAATAGIGVVLAAVRGGRTAFTAVGLVALLAVAGAAAFLGRRAARQCLRAPDAPCWVDAARDLRGRLPSLLELDGRSQGAFFDLLVAQGVDTRERWRPEDVVPDVVPARSFALALTACALLALSVALAPRLRPPAPRLVAGDRRMDFVRTGEPADAERLLVTPGREHPAPQRDGDPAARAEPPGAVAEAAEAARDWLREALGVTDDWEAGALEAPAEASRAGGEPPRGARPGAAADPDGAGGAPGRDARGDAARPAAGDTGDTAEPRQAGEGGAGAGDGTDPSLYGEPQDAAGAGRDRFELAIAARVRTRRGSAMAPWTTAPGADADRDPALAARQLAEQPAHRMPVPPAFAPIVRRAYAHTAPPPEEAR